MAQFVARLSAIHPWKWALGAVLAFDSWSLMHPPTLTMEPAYCGPGMYPGMRFRTDRWATLCIRYNDGGNVTFWSMDAPGGYQKFVPFDKRSMAGTMTAFANPKTILLPAVYVESEQIHF